MTCNKTSATITNNKIKQYCNNYYVNVVSLSYEQDSDISRTMLEA